jgi:hypothetical protein
MLFVKIKTAFQEILFGEPLWAMIEELPRSTLEPDSGTAG